jgi:hypothetical protein
MTTLINAMEKRRKRLDERIISSLNCWKTHVSHYMLMPKFIELLEYEEPRNELFIEEMKSDHAQLEREFERDQDKIEKDCEDYQENRNRVDTIIRLAKGELTTVAFLVYNNFWLRSFLYDVFEFGYLSCMTTDLLDLKCEDDCLRIRDNYECVFGFIEFEFQIPKGAPAEWRYRYKESVSVNYSGELLGPDDLYGKPDYEKIFKMVETTRHARIELIPGGPDDIHDTKIVKVDSVMVTRKNDVHIGAVGDEYAPQL